MSNVPEVSGIPETQEVIEDDELKTSEITATKQHDLENEKAQDSEELIVNGNDETQVEIRKLNEDDCYEPKTSVDTTSNTQPEIQHIEAGNKGTDKATDKEEIEKQLITSLAKAKLKTVLAPLMIMLWGCRRRESRL